MSVSRSMRFDWVESTPVLALVRTLALWLDADISGNIVCGLQCRRGTTGQSSHGLQNLCNVLWYGNHMRHIAILRIVFYFLPWGEYWLRLVGGLHSWTAPMGRMVIQLGIVYASMNEVLDNLGVSFCSGPPCCQCRTFLEFFCSISVLSSLWVNWIPLWSILTGDANVPLPHKMDRDVAYSCLWWLIIVALPLQDMTSAIRCGKGLGAKKMLTSRKFWFSPWRSRGRVCAWTQSCFVRR